MWLTIFILFFLLRLEGGSDVQCEKLTRCVPCVEADCIWLPIEDNCVKRAVWDNPERLAVCQEQSISIDTIADPCGGLVETECNLAANCKWIAENCLVVDTIHILGPVVIRSELGPVQIKVGDEDVQPSWAIPHQRPIPTNRPTYDPSFFPSTSTTFYETSSSPSVSTTLYSPQSSTSEPSPPASTLEPSPAPSSSTSEPSSGPLASTPEPSASTLEPTALPSKSSQPSKLPSTSTSNPSKAPQSSSPSSSPVQCPSKSPDTSKPTFMPSPIPTFVPTKPPTTSTPTDYPTTSQPSTSKPTWWPTTSRPTWLPTTRPTDTPTRLPTRKPTLPLVFDCDHYFFQHQCFGKTHEGKICMWDVDERECIESSPGDPEHLCAQWSDPENCQYFPDCGWDAPSNRCMQNSDLPALPFSPSPFNNQPFGDIGFGGPFGGFSDFNAPMGRNGYTYRDVACEEFYSQIDCEGHFFELSRCVWDRRSYYCYEQNMEDVCDTEINRETCKAINGCGWQSFGEGATCAVCNEVNPHQRNRVQGCGSDNAGGGYPGAHQLQPQYGYGTIECEDFRSPSQCDGKNYYGASCYWAIIGNRCQMAGYLMSPRNAFVCRGYRIEGVCKENLFCRWKPHEATCIARSQYSIDQRQRNILRRSHHQTKHAPPWLLPSALSVGLIAGCLLSLCFKFRRRKMEGELSQALAMDAQLEPCSTNI